MCEKKSNKHEKHGRERSHDGGRERSHEGGRERSHDGGRERSHDDGREDDLGIYLAGGSMRRRTLVIRNHGYLKRGTGARFLTVDLERKTGITGVPFGRTEVSIPFV